MNVCVFCGASTGHNPIYTQAAQSLANVLTASKCTLVYGGGNIGLMGIIADQILRNGGNVIGVIPDFLVQKELAHQGIGQLEIVRSMHERKKRMADLSDAFIAMPGGWGTLDELAEILTWKQLGLISQPIGLLNVNNYFTPLIEQMKMMVEEGFLGHNHMQEIIIEKIPQMLLTRIGIATA